jgi:hypothetical protein
LVVLTIFGDILVLASDPETELAEELDAAVLDKHDIMDYTCIYNLYMHIKYATTNQYTVQWSPCNMLSMVHVVHC